MISYFWYHDTNNKIPMWGMWRMSIDKTHFISHWKTHLNSLFLKNFLTWIFDSWVPWYYLEFLTCALTLYKYISHVKSDVLIWSFCSGTYYEQYTWLRSAHSPSVAISYVYNKLIVVVMYLFSSSPRLIGPFFCNLQLLWYALCRFACEFHKNEMRNDAMVTSFKFSPYNCPYFQFYWIYKLHFWYKHSTTLNASND